MGVSRIDFIGFLWNFLDLISHGLISLNFLVEDFIFLEFLDLISSSFYEIFIDLILISFWIVNLICLDFFGFDFIKLLVVLV